MARPVEYTPERLAEIAKQIDEYTDKTDRPSIEEFALKYNYRRSFLYEYDELSDSLEKLRMKRQLALENNGLNGKYNYGITKLLLSQLGVVEKKEIIEDVTHKTIDKDGNPKGIDFSKLNTEDLEKLV